MFKAQYRVTPYLLKLFERIAIVGALVRNSRLQVSVKAPLERDAFARSVHSSTWIEGNLLSLAQGRAVGQWLLWEKGFDPLCTLGLDDFFAQGRPRYYDMIQQTREMDGDFTHWVEYVAQGLAWAHDDAQKRIKAGTLSLQGVSLTPKQEELLGMLEKKGVLGASEIGKTMKINRARVNQLISPLVRLGIVTREGAARAVRYRLNEK